MTGRNQQHGQSRRNSQNSPRKASWYIASHKEEYPQSLLELLERNPETVDFVYDYPKKGQQQPEN